MSHEFGSLFYASQYILSARLNMFYASQRTHLRELSPSLTRPNQISRVSCVSASVSSSHVCVSSSQNLPLSSQPFTLERMGFSARVPEKRSLNKFGGACCSALVGMKGGLSEREFVFHTKIQTAKAM